MIVDEIIIELSSHLGLRAPAITKPDRLSDLVKVDLPGRAYDIVIGSGLLETAGDRIAALGKDLSVSIITDETVAEHHLATLQNSLQKANIRSAPVIIPQVKNQNLWPW